MKYKFIFFLILGLDGLNLFYQTSQISIAYRETLILNGDISPLQALVNISIFIFGQNDFALRLPMIAMHFLSVIIFYNISSMYVDQRNRLWLLFVFILLPGVLSSAFIIDEAGLILLCLLAFVWTYLNSYRVFSYILLLSFVLLDNNFIYLFLSLAIYAIYVKDKNFFIFNMLVFFISIFFFGTEAHGTPKGHFIDSLGLYSAVFSPIVFIYLVFSLYRSYLAKDLDVVWFISTSTVLVSLLLSFRQSIHIEHFAPYLILALPIAAKTFVHSYRVRLKQFRQNYKIIFIVSFIFLLLNTLLLIFNKELYSLIDNPKKHFAYKYHIAKELAYELNKKSVNCVDTNYKMQKRLEFYGVTKCVTNKLSRNRNETLNSIPVTVSYKNKIVYLGYVTKINN